MVRLERFSGRCRTDSGNVVSAALGLGATAPFAPGPHSGVWGWAQPPQGLRGPLGRRAGPATRAPALSGRATLRLMFT